MSAVPEDVRSLAAAAAPRHVKRRLVDSRWILVCTLVAVSLSLLTATLAYAVGVSMIVVSAAASLLMIRAVVAARRIRKGDDLSADVSLLVGRGRP